MADANLLDMLRRSGGIEAVSKQLGLAPGVAAQGVEALLPALVGGFAKRGEAAGGGEAGLGALVGVLGGLGGGALAANVLGPDETGDPTGAAWTEAGALDKRGHAEGWKLARSVEAEVRDLASRIGALLQAGWTEVRSIGRCAWKVACAGSTICGPS